MRLPQLLPAIGALAWIATLASPTLAVTTPPDDADPAGTAPENNAVRTDPPDEVQGANAAAPPTAPVTPPPRAQDWAHRVPTGPAANAGPLQLSWVDFEAIQPGLFPGVRHHVRRWTSATTSWVSPNSPSSIIPEPPRRGYGPTACGCPAPVGSADGPDNVYGAMERDRLWTWCVDFFDPPGDSHPEQTHFIPDIWAGRGPCRALNRRGVLHRFPAEQTERDANGRWFLRPTTRRTMDAQSEIDEGLIAQLWPTEAARLEQNLPDVDRRVFLGAGSPDELRELWASWVQTLLTRRGYILHDLLIFASYRWLEASDRDAWQKLIENEHFGPAPLGVWFDDTVTYAAQIRYYLMLGVPVYYRWDVEFFGNARLADLRPRDPPVNAERGIPNPPLSPHRPVNRRALALWMHDNLKRAPPPPVPAPEDDDPFNNSEPEVLDDRDFDMLSDAMTEIEDNWQKQRGAPSSNSTRPGLPVPLRDRITTGPPVLSARPGSSQPSLMERMAAPPRAPVNLLARFDAGSGPAGSSRTPAAPAAPPRGPVAESRARMVTTMATTPAGTHQPGFEDSWRFAVTTDTPASRSFLDMLRSGQLPTHQERIGFSFETGMPFATPVRRQPTAFDIAQSWLNHAVRDDWFISPSMTPAEQLARWREAATRVLARPHARAAILRGGLLARIAIHFGLDLSHALQGPSDDARMNGSPYPMEDVDGTELWDDYLSTDEIAILVGQVGVGGTLTLFPRPETFATFWWGDGAWTAEHEQWFLNRLRELETASQPAGRTRDGWRSALKKNQRYPQS